MNKIFKTKYDITTGQTKAVSELASNRQVASSSEKAKCGGLLGYSLGVFKLAPLACGLFSGMGYAANVWIDNGTDGVNLQKTGYLNESTRVGNWNGKAPLESVILSSGSNKTGNQAKYTNKDFKETVVIGSRAVVGGSGATAVGYRAIVGKNLDSTKIEQNHQGTAVGYRSFAYGTESTALGNDAVAYGDSSISIGSDTISGMSNSYASKGLSYDIWKLFRQNGEKFNYTGEYSAVDGQDHSIEHSKYEEYLKNPQKHKTHNWAYGNSAIAIGNRNVAYGNSSLAVGNASVAAGNYSTALGTGVLAFGNSSVAVGNETYVYANKSVGVGNQVQAIKDGAMVYGLESYAGGNGSLALGKRALANVEMSAEFKQDVEQFGQNLYEGESSYNGLVKLDGNNGGRTLDEYFKPKTEKQSGTEEDKAIDSKSDGGIAIGYYVSALGENTIAMGRQAYSKGDRSIAMGAYAYSKGEKSAALGYGAKAIGEESLSLGSLSRAEGKNSIAIGIKSAVKKDNNGNKRSGENTVAIGNETEATMDNSVALGYKSTTKYFYKNDTDKSNATLNGKDAIELESYAPEGTSYKIKTDNTAGIVSVGWKKGGNELGLRRIVGVAAGALDSDVATVGQLKALYYVKKEGVVTYYTKETNGTITKLTKGDDGKFYRVNTKDGTPYKDLGHIDANNVFVGPKGASEATREEMIKGTKYSLGNMGEKIKFANVLDGEISATSDQAITGHQLKNVGDILGVSVNNTDTTKFDKPNFSAVKYVGGKQGRDTFKGAINELINAVNKGYKFSDGNVQNTHINTLFYLGSTLEIKADDISSNGAKTHLGKNLKTKFEKDPSNNSVAKFKIGLKEDPSFKKVTIEEQINDSSDQNLAVNKKYVDDKFQNVATSFTVSGNSGSYVVKDKLDIKGKADVNLNQHKNITTTAKNGTTKELEIALNSTLKGITSIGKDDNNKITFDGGTKIKANGAELTLTKDNSNKVKLSNVADGKSDYDAVNFKQLEAAKTRYVSINSTEKTEGSNYKNDGAKADKSIAIGVKATANTNAEETVVIGTNIDVNVRNSVALGSNINIEQNSNDNNRKDAVVAIGSGLKLKNAKSSIVIGAVDERSMADNSEANDAWRTVVEDATWSVVLGNKTKIKNGDDVLALGNNIIAKGTAQGKISGLVILGNRAKATDAKNSVVIGTSAESKAESAVVLGKGANVAANATGAVAIGESANVAAAAGDSVALGKNSVAENKKTVATSQEVNVGTNSLKFDWKNGGTGQKSVVSVGSTGNERVITNVAAGEVRDGSTDAINGSQLDSVIRVFGKLGTDILGAEVNSDKEFEQSNFDKVHYAGTTKNTTNTFRDAINETITAINKGLKFTGNTGGDKQLQLGDKLTIQGKEDTANGNHKNITTEAKDSGILEIALNEELKEIVSIAGKKVQGGNSKFVGSEIKFNDKQAGNNQNTNVVITSNGAKYTFDPQGFHMGNKQITALASGLNLPTNGGDSTTITGKVLKGTPDNDSNAVNVKDLSTVAKAIVDKGLKFGGNTGAEITRKLGEKLTIKGDGTDLTSKAENNAITFMLNKATGISDQTATNGDKDKVVTAGAVKTYVDSKTGSFSSTLSIEADNSQNGNPSGTVNLKTEKLKVAGTENEIETKVEQGKQSITLGFAQATKDKLGVITVEGDKLALGKGSKTVDKTTALDGAEITVGQNSLKFDWKGAGTSADTTDGNKKSVISVGDTGKERLIKHVAAGEVTPTSTDAVNGGQLHSVIDVFAKLGFDILGAEKADNGKDGFKTPTFVKLKDKNGTDTNQVPATFKEAIDGLITTVNQGLMFAGDTGTKFTSQLGATVNIKGKEDTVNNKHKNISTEATNGTLEIALNENLKGIKSIENGENAKIALGSVNGSDKTITFTSGDNKDNVTLKGSTLSGVSEINKETDKGALKLTENSATLESAKDNSKVELKDKAVTITAQEDKGTLKLTENTAS
ncbi:hypothetical protein ACE4RU_04705, partial [Actinobacillus seminis]|uniref:hypothetical protein n=1 Tax=Actinobacillus seminis TaxID=722 RepID=UPI003B9654F4